MTLRRLLMRASGPARLRSDLRRMTRPVRRYRARLGVLGSVRAQIPRAVLGGDLLDLLSDQLRSAIEQEGEQRAPIVDERRSRSSLLVPLANGQAPGFPALPATSPAARPPSPTDAAFGSLDPAWAVGMPSEASRDPFRAFGEAAQGSTIEDFAQARTTTGNSPGVMERGDVPARRAAAPPTALARSVRAYWRSDGATPPATSRADMGASGRDERRQPPAAEAAPDAPVARAWPEQMANTLMERMTSFVAGRTPSASTGTPTNGANAANGTAEYAAPPAAPSGVWGTAASLHNLGDQVAEILREQATQHGIDLV